jgi:D-alanyl-D-alanine carboxypeptidase (penicillin-binding protein 5/6)
MEFRPGRVISVVVGSLVILGIGVYGPVTLLAPLPEVHAEILTPSNAVATVAPPALPAEGANAIVADDATTPIATTGTADPVPIAGVAKVVAALVTVDAKPVGVGGTGANLSITAADYADYIDYGNAGARTVPVFLGENWTEREVLQAVLLGSSNNHADTLVRWAFGSVDDYVTAANVWLVAHGLTGTHVADATGLDGDSVGTATDAARIAALITAEPALNEILSNPATSLVNSRGVDNTTDYFSDLGVFGISRSFTDPAGVCFLFTKTVGEGAEAVTIAGAFLRQPDYDTLETDLTAFVASAAAGAAPAPVIASGQAYARFRAPWGAEADGVTGVALTRSPWSAGADALSVDVEGFSTKSEGSLVGHVRLSTDGSVPLKLSTAIRDPGLGWRLLHPIPMIESLLASQG